MSALLTHLITVRSATSFAYFFNFFILAPHFILPCSPEILKGGGKGEEEGHDVLFAAAAAAADDDDD